MTLYCSKDDAFQHYATLERLENILSYCFHSSWCLLYLFGFFFIFLFSCSPQWSGPIAVPEIFDFWQVKSPFLNACHTFLSSTSSLSFKWCMSARYTADQRLYLIRSKLEKSLIIASKDERYKSQSRERTASMKVNNLLTRRKNPIKNWCVLLSFLFSMVIWIFSLKSNLSICLQNFSHTKVQFYDFQIPRKLPK